MKRLIFFTLAVSLILGCSFSDASKFGVTKVESDGYCVQVNYKAVITEPVTPACRRVITPGPTFSAVPPCVVPVNDYCGRFRNSENLIKNLFCLPLNLAKKCVATVDSCF